VTEHQHQDQDQDQHQDEHDSVNDSASADHHSSEPPEVRPSAGAAVSHASKQEDPVADAEGRGALGAHATGDIVIDSALQDLQNTPEDDLDAQIEAGSRVQQTLQARLSDLGGA
jgi:hypothetical protein